MFRLVLVCSLLFAIAGCSEETPPEPQVLPPALPGVKQTVTASVAMSPYQTALASLRNARSYAYSADITSPEGQTTMNGAQQDGRHLIVVQSSPANTSDGRWLLQGGRSHREVNGRFESQPTSVRGYDAVVNALTALPANDDSALPDAGSDACQLRRFDLQQLRSLSDRYTAFEVCITDQPPMVTELRATEVDGRRVELRLKDYGVAVTIPDAGVKEWWQEYPQTRP